MVLILALASGEDAGDVGHLVEIDPKSAHGVMHAGEYLHGDFARVVADELLIDLKDAFELAVERGGINVCEVEIDHLLAVNAQALFEDNVMDLTCGNVTRDKVAVLGILLFEEVV